MSVWALASMTPNTLAGLGSSQPHGARSLEICSRGLALPGGQPPPSRSEADQIGGQLEDGARSPVEGQVFKLGSRGVAAELRDDPTLMCVDRRRLALV
jgi:hypothetical protein